MWRARTDRTTPWCQGLMKKMGAVWNGYLNPGSVRGGSEILNRYACLLQDCHQGTSLHFTMERDGKYAPFFLS